MKKGSNPPAQENPYEAPKEFTLETQGTVIEHLRSINPIEWLALVCGITFSVLALSSYIASFREIHDLNRDLERTVDVMLDAHQKEQETRAEQEAESSEFGSQEFISED